MSEFDSDLLTIDLGDLEAGELRPLQLTAVVEAATDIGSVRPPVVITGQLTGTGTGAVAVATIAATLDLACVRCLLPWAADVGVELNAVFEPVDDPDVFPVVERSIDLEIPVRDELLAAIADNPIHDADCRGLCGSCGFDLNNGDCECPEVELSSPFAELKDLFDS